MKKKLILVFGIILATLLLVTPVFAWFYFPNSKGLEIDTPSAEDISLKLYKLINNYNDDGTYKDSEFIDLSDEDETYKDSEDNDVPYLTGNGYVIPESFEFFEWGDEFICESTDANYYALECSYNSKAFNDGYVKSILTTTLRSKGNTYDGNNSKYVAFPILDASYKFASSANAMSTPNPSSFISEIKDDDGYNDIIERYYKKDGNNYIELSPDYFETGTFDFDEEKLYTGNLIEFTGDSFDSNITYYEYSYDEGIIEYIVTDKNQPINKQKRYFTATFTEITGKDIAYSSDNTYRYIFSDISSDVFKDNLDSTQFLDSNDEILKFVIFIRIRPNEEFVTDIMYGIREEIDETKTELKIDNEIKFEINLRSVPKKSGTITSTTTN